MKRPFRFHLRTVRPKTDAEASERLALLRQATRLTWPENDIVERVLELGDEELLFIVLRNTDAPLFRYNAFGGTEEQSRKELVMNRALAALKESGEAWNPIIDELIAQETARQRVRFLWQRANNYRGDCPFPSDSERGLLPCCTVK